MTDLDLSALEAIAKQATPGPWFAKVNDLIGGMCVMPVDMTPGEASDTGQRIGEVGDFMGNDADFVATFNPETVLALIGRVREAEDPPRVALNVEWQREMLQKRNVDLRARLEAVEAELESAKWCYNTEVDEVIELREKYNALRARIKALADEWDGRGYYGVQNGDELRALLDPSEGGNDE